MSVEQPIFPAYTSGQTVSATGVSASVSIVADAKQLILTNLGVNVCYVRAGVTGVTATTTDYPVLPGMQVTISKPTDFDKLAYISSAGTQLHVMTGEGW
jgi:hypothetical protein